MQGRGQYLGGEIEGGEADEGPIAGDLVDDEVRVAVLEDAAEAGEGGGEAGYARLRLGEWARARHGSGWWRELGFWKEKNGSGWWRELGFWKEKDGDWCEGASTPRDVWFTFDIPICHSIEQVTQKFILFFECGNRMFFLQNVVHVSFCFLKKKTWFMV
jgi:hypothetical protein